MPGLLACGTQSHHLLNCVCLLDIRKANTVNGHYYCIMIEDLESLARVITAEKSVYRNAYSSVVCYMERMFLRMCTSIRPPVSCPSRSNRLTIRKPGDSLLSL